MCLLRHFRQRSVPFYVTLQSGFQFGLRSVAKGLSRLGDIRPGLSNITGLHGLPIDGRVCSQRGFQGRNELAERNGAVLSEIEHVKGSARLLTDPGHGPHNTVHRIVHVGVVATSRPIAVHRDRLAAIDKTRELGDRQIGPLSRTVDSEKPQGGDTHAVKMTVGVTQEFAGLLGCRVGRDRMIDPRIFAEGHLIGVAVDRGTGGKNQVGYVAGDHGLQEIHRAVDVHLRVALGVFDAGSHSRFGGQVHHMVDGAPRFGGGAEHACQRAGIPEIGIVKAKAGGTQELFQITIFDPSVVIAVKIVDAVDYVAVGDEALCQVRTNEPRRAGDKDIHDLRMVPPRGRCYNPRMTTRIANAELVLTARGVIPHQDVVITDGIITAVEPAADPGDGETLIDGRNRAVVTGWKNAHTHAAMTLFRGYGDDMRLQPWLADRIWPAEAALTGEDLYWGTRLAAVEMIKSGTTFANDMYFQFPQVWRAFADSGMRAAVGLALFDFGDPRRREAVQREVETLLSSLPQQDHRRLQLTIAPHSIYTCSGELLQWAAKTAEDLGLVFHIHMAETQQEVTDCVEQHGCRPFQWLDELGVLQRVHNRAVAAHGIWMDGDERKLAAQAGVTIAHNPASNMKLASGTLDWQALRSAGVPLMLAPDGVASNNNLDMYDEMKLAALLQKHATGDPTRLPAAEVVALAAGEMSSVFAPAGVGGHLSVGSAADLQMLDLNHPQMTPVHNLESNLAYAANGSAVDTVLIDGEVVMEHRGVAGEEEVIREARRCAHALVERANR